MNEESVVVVGAGHAGVQVAISLRQGGYSHPITLIGDEPGLPYQRPPLSKAFLLGKTDAQGLWFRPAAFYADQNITLLHDTVVAIERDAHQVRLASGRLIGYTHLVLATGARNRQLPVPGAELPGVHGIRTLADAERLLSLMPKVRRVVVVGAGFIGLEFAAAASTLGASVSVLEAAPRPMARAVSQSVSTLFTQAHTGWGVHLSFGDGLAAIEGNEGKVAAVRTSSGRRIETDLVVYGIGVIANVEVAVEAGLAVNDGVVVNDVLLTQDPAISAIGDVAHFPCVQAGRSLRLESVQNALDQARHVAARLTGQKVEPYAALPWFWSDQRDFKLQIAGLSDGCDRSMGVGASSANAMTVLCFKHERLIAVETVNRPGDHVAAKRILIRDRRPSPDEAVREGFELKAWEAENR